MNAYLRPRTMFPVQSANNSQRFRVLYRLSTIIFTTTMILMILSISLTLQLFINIKKLAKKQRQPSIIFLDKNGGGVLETRLVPWVGYGVDNNNHQENESSNDALVGHDLVENIGFVSDAIDDNSAQKKSGPDKDAPSCVPMAPEWQVGSFPNCNIIHEFDLFHGLSESGHDKETKILGVGGKRIAWKASYGEGSKPIIIKTKRWEKEYNELVYEKNRRDAMAMERLTFSSNVIDVYGFCASAILNEMGYMGADEFFQTTKLSSLKKLRYAKEAADALADVHSIRAHNATALVHGDTRPWNFLLTDKGKHMKIHDFNEAKFIKWDPKEGKACRFSMFWCNRNRSPEECNRGSSQNEKIDVYGLGNLIHYILVKNLPYSRLHLDSETIHEMVQTGIPPPLPKDIRESSNPRIVAMREAMDQCHIYDQEMRPSAREIATQLTEAYNKLIKEK